MYCLFRYAVIIHCFPGLKCRHTNAKCKLKLQTRKTALKQRQHLLAGITESK